MNGEDDQAVNNNYICNRIEGTYMLESRYNLYIKNLYLTESMVLKNIK